MCSGTVNSFSTLGKNVFLMEELMIPNANKNDTMRMNMVSNHFNQMIVLRKPELPKVFTGFENQFGQYSCSYKVADNDYEVTSIIFKNDYNKLLVLKEKGTKKYSIVKIANANLITENYGFMLYDNIDIDKTKEFKKGDVVYKSSSYDNEMNFCYGLNLNAIYMPFKNLTYEDAIVLSRSAADKFDSYGIDEITISINNNDLLLNMYGDEENYQPFPNIDSTIVDKIVAVRRRINYNTAIYELRDDMLMGEDNILDTDTVFYSEGKVVDIDVFCNKSVESIDYKYNSFIIDRLTENEIYNKKVKYELEQIISDPANSVSDDMLVEYYDVCNMLDPEKKWVDQKEFDNIVVRLKVEHVRKLEVGDKITNRYGAKGVVSAILPDEEMPITECGKRADIILSHFSIVNRTNVGQLFEHNINFYADRICEIMSSELNSDNIAEVFEKHIMNFYRIVDTDTYNIMKTIYGDEEEMMNTIVTIIAKGFYIKQNPFHDNLDIYKLKQIVDAYPEIKKYNFFYSGKQIATPMVMGNMYFIRLKQYAESKFSARSSGTTNLKKTPTKSKNYKHHEELFSKTPIRLGEMETNNLQLLDEMDTLNRFNKIYSSNDDMRKKSMDTLLTDPNIIPEKIEDEADKKSNIRLVINQLLHTINLKIIDEE